MLEAIEVGAMPHHRELLLLRHSLSVG